MSTTTATVAAEMRLVLVKGERDADSSCTDECSETVFDSRTKNKRSSHDMEEHASTENPIIKKIRPNRDSARPISLHLELESPYPPTSVSRFVLLKAKKVPKQYGMVSTQPVVAWDGDGRDAWVQRLSCMISCKTFPDPAALQCTACTSRQWSSGGCRFQNIREFFCEPSHLRQGVVPYRLIGDFDSSNTSLHPSPLTWTSGHSMRDAEALLSGIGPAFEKILSKEVLHEARDNVLRRAREEHTRPVCDGCATTIFSGHWLCFVCGRELCLDCYDEWDDTESALARFLQLNSCRTRKGQTKRFHTKQQMIPYTRFHEKETSTYQSMLSSSRHDDETQDSSQSTLPLCHVLEGLPYVSADISRVPVEDFRVYWATGKPLLLSGFCERFTLNCGPDYFIENFGSEVAELVDVISREVRQSTVGEFFRGLRSGTTSHMQHLKLNDWPVVDDFATAMPELFNNFEAALPFPEYTRRKGFFNLASWFPPQYLPPDLGPKLYCAGASSDGPGRQGTTVLHMDMTDAINIMTWAGERPTDRPGCAVWDVFRQEDAMPLRQYILEKLREDDPKTIMDDPIRRAQFYLTTEDLDSLEKVHNVLPCRIYQNPGDAVLIPAGCAHQVCNLTPCIKIACDFVSPENVQRCSIITTADRRLATLAKREDVLQLKNLIYFAFVGALDYLERGGIDRSSGEHAVVLSDHHLQSTSGSASTHLEPNHAADQTREPEQKPRQPRRGRPIKTVDHAVSSDTDEDSATVSPKPKPRTRKRKMRSPATLPPPPPAAKRSYTKRTAQTAYVAFVEKYGFAVLKSMVEADALNNLSSPAKDFVAVAASGASPASEERESRLAHHQTTLDTQKDGEQEEQEKQKDEKEAGVALRGMDRADFPSPMSTLSHITGIDDQTDLEDTASMTRDAHHHHHHDEDTREGGEGTLLSKTSSTSPGKERVAGSGDLQQVLHHSIDGSLDTAPANVAST